MGRLTDALVVLALAGAASGCFAAVPHAGIASEGLGHDDRLPPLPPPEGSRPGTTETTGAEQQAPEADDHEHVVETGSDLPASATPPAVRYAALDRAACEAELTRRGASFERVESARGVVAPLRLRGPLSGVTFRSALPATQRKTAVIEIVDCRLALAMDDLAKVLARHDVVEVVHMSMYRPASKRVTLKGPGRRHTGALAIDVGTLVTKDGRTLDVLKDFHGGIGQKPCGPKAPGNPSELRAIYCEIADAGLFNVMLSPDYNWAHRNHFHLEVTANVRWTLVR